MFAAWADVIKSMLRVRSLGLGGFAQAEYTGFGKFGLELRHGAAEGLRIDDDLGGLGGLGCGRDSAASCHSTLTVCVDRC